MATTGEPRKGNSPVPSHTHICTYHSGKDSHFAINAVAYYFKFFLLLLYHKTPHRLNNEINRQLTTNAAWNQIYS